MTIIYNISSNKMEQESNYYLWQYKNVFMHKTEHTSKDKY